MSSTLQSISEIVATKGRAEILLHLVLLRHE
jgi:hypothetical protein